MSYPVWLCAGIAAVLSLIGFALALTVSPGAINMGVGCSIVTGVMAAFALTLERGP